MTKIVYSGRQGIVYSKDPLKGQFCNRCKHYDPNKRPCELNPGQRMANLANRCECYKDR
jgi:hypothetical protein